MGITYNIRQIAQSLETPIIELWKDKPYKSLFFVAHSLGGLVARKFILDHYQKYKIDSLILLATPNFGSRMAKLPNFFGESAHLQELADGGYIDVLNDDWRKEFRVKNPQEPFDFSAAYELNPTKKLLTEISHMSIKIL